MDRQGEVTVFVIAEAGVNHNGSLSLAKRLADTASEAGADAVKYQIFDAAKLTTEYAEKAEYQMRNDEVGESSQKAMLQSLQLSYEDFLELRDYCSRIGIMFLATAFDKDSLDFLVNEIGTDLIKVPSGEITNYPYLVQIARYGKPVLLSTGMSSRGEVAASIRLLREHGAGEVTILHCNTQYPTPYEDVNLLAMVQMGLDFEAPFGYSDHTPGVEVPVAAVALGACVVEKHFTLDKEMEGPDHKASLDPQELAAMIKAIRHVEKSLGSSQKVITGSERENRNVARKSIVAARPIKRGELFTEDNLTTKRPGTGMSPMLWPNVVGTVASKDYSEDEMIEEK